MSKKAAQNKYSQKYDEVLAEFHLMPDFNFTDYEKEVVQYIEKAGVVTNFDLSDTFDLRPSEVKDIVQGLVEKHAIKEEDGNIELTEGALKYMHASKEERKTEKKFRKFLNTLDEKDLNKLLKLVHSFEVKEVVTDTKGEEK